MALYKRQTPPQRSVNFIFHTAFCGSTLLGKYLENPGWTFVYREPAILTSLALLRFEPASYTDQWQDIFELMLALLSRTNSCNEVPIIKLHDGCSCIIDNLLSMNPDSKGLILYSDWHSFLVSILRNPYRRKWVRNRLKSTDFRKIDLLRNVNIHSLIDVEAAACLWLAQIYTYLTALERQDRRLYNLDCCLLFQSPQKALRAIIDYFCISSSFEDIIDTLKRYERVHVKTGHKYDSKARARYNEFIGKIYKSEIRIAYEWIEKVTGESSLITELPLSIC